MNQLEIFEHPEFGAVRTMEIDGEPWLVGKDVAQALGYNNTRKAIIDHVDEEDKGVTKCDTLGGAQELTIINESGLYSLIFSSQLPDAKKFKRWVTHEVLPSIRKNGGYIVDQEQMRRETRNVIRRELANAFSDILSALSTENAPAKPRRRAEPQSKKSNVTDDETLLKAVAGLVSATKTHSWKGTATELADALQVRKKPYILTRRLNALQERLLEEYHIIYVNTHTHLGSHIDLIYTPLALLQDEKKRAGVVSVVCERIRRGLKNK